MTNNTEPRGGFKGWVSTIGAILGFFITLIAFIINIQNWAQDPLALRSVSAAGFILFFLGTMWFAFKVKNVKPAWRWTSLAVLYVSTIIYFSWVGTWLGSPSTLAPTEIAPSPTLTSTIAPSATDTPTPTFSPTPTSSPSLTPTPTPRVSIESLGLVAFPYGGEGDPRVRRGRGSLSIIYEEASPVGYILDYSLPDTGEGYAGLAFRFHQSQDLTDFEAVEMTISFGDEQARCEVFFKDIDDQTDYVRLGVPMLPTSDVAVRIDGQKQTLRIPLSTNFPRVDISAVREIGFNANTSFSPRGTHTCTVTGINFLRP